VNETITVICAWCGKVLKQGNSELVSHGICEDCAAVLLEEVPNAEELGEPIRF